MKRFLLAALLGLAMNAPAQSLSGHSQSPEEAAKTLVASAGVSRLILLGEMHGTREIPRLVAHVVSHYAAEGPVLLGLEIPDFERRFARAAEQAVKHKKPRECLAEFAPRFWGADANESLNGGACQDDSLPVQLARRNSLEGAGELEDLGKALAGPFWSGRMAQRARLTADARRSRSSSV